MRSKKLLRQFKKSLDCEGIENELDSIQQWLNSKSDDEVPQPLSKLISNFKTFLDSIESAYEQAEVIYNQAQRSLVISGQEIEDRNQLLRAENQKVSNLLNNMRQSVFTVSENRKIAGPVSKYSETVFDREIAEQNVFDILYYSMPRDSEEFSALESAMTVVFGESDLQWDLSEESFPRRIILTGDSKSENASSYKSEKILKVAYSPIWNENNLLNKIMFVVEDVTELEKLERRIAQEKAQASRAFQIVHELIAVKRKDIYDFIESSQGQLLEFKKHMQSLSDGADSMSNLLQLLHTIKGNARLLGFTIISSTVHKSESVVVPLHEKLVSSPALWVNLKPSIHDAIDSIMHAIGECQHMFYKLFGSESSNAESADSLLDIDPSQLYKLKRIVSLAKETPSADAIQNISDAIEHLSDVSLCKVFEKYSRAVTQMALDLNKEVDFNVTSEDCFISREKVPLIKDAITHLIRNAIDHGLEFPDERKQAGKATTGLIKLMFKKTENKSLIWVSDDGKGIDTDIISAKIREKKIHTGEELEQMSNEEILDFIFLPNFSTRDEVTEFSGRGIGMDVVRTNITKLGGSIVLETKLGKGTLFKISIPNK